MPIETKPEEKTLSGPELEAAVTDGIQRAIGRRVGNLRLVQPDVAALRATGRANEYRGLDGASITVEVLGSLKGPKPGTKRKPRSKPATAA